MICFRSQTKTSFAAAETELSGLFEDDVEQLRRMSEDRMLEDGARRLAELAGLDMYLLLPTLELEIRSLQIYPEVAKESNACPYRLLE